MLFVDILGGGMPSPGGMSSPGNSRPATPISDPMPVHAPATPNISRVQMLPPLPQEQTTLLHNEEESFALAPVDASALRGTIRTKRKRKLIVDEIKAIAGEEMKAQLSDTADIVTTLDLAPPTKRLMHWKETGGVEKLFALPGKPLHSRALFDLYQAHLVSQQSENEYFGLLGDSEADTIQLENVAGMFGLESDEPKTPGPKKPGRKRKEPVPSEMGEAAPAFSPVKRSSRLADQQKENVPPMDGSDHIPATPGGDIFSQTNNTSGGAEMANMGYDQHSTTQMDNLGWDQGAPTPGGPASMGAPTPYRYVLMIPHPLF